MKPRKRKNISHVYNIIMALLAGCQRINSKVKSLLTISGENINIVIILSLLSSIFSWGDGSIHINAGYWTSRFVRSADETVLTWASTMSNQYHSTGCLWQPKSRRSKMGVTAFFPEKFIHSSIFILSVTTARRRDWLRAWVRIQHVSILWGGSQISEWQFVHETWNDDWNQL